jgi:hypothetical protein
MVGSPRSAADCAEIDRVIAQLHGRLPAIDIEMELQRSAAMTAEQAVEAALLDLTPAMFNAKHSTADGSVL